MEYKSQQLAQHSIYSNQKQREQVARILPEPQALCFITKSQHFFEQNKIEHRNLMPRKTTTVFKHAQHIDTQQKQDSLLNSNHKLFDTNNKILERRQPLPKIVQEDRVNEAKDARMSTKKVVLNNSAEYPYKTLKQIKQKGNNNEKQRPKRSVFNNIGILQLKNNLKRSTTPYNFKNKKCRPSINNSLFNQDNHDASTEVKPNLLLSTPKTQQTFTNKQNIHLPSSHKQIYKNIQASPKKIELKSPLNLNQQKNMQISSELLFNDTSKSKGRIYQQKSNNISIITCFPHQKQIRSFPLVNNLQQWKRRNKLTIDEKVFIITGGYRDFNLALRSRGWVQNTESDSPCFDLKFTLQGKEIAFKKLLPFQCVNHYQNNTIITTKVGLLKTLRNSTYTNDISQDSYFPKCYDLNNESDLISFQSQFKLSKAISILKTYTQKLNMELQFSPQDQLQEKRRVQVALRVCRRNLQDINDLIDYKEGDFRIVTDQEWEVLASDQISQKQLSRRKEKEWMQGLLNKTKLFKCIKQNEQSSSLKIITDNNNNNGQNGHQTNKQAQMGCKYFKRNKDEPLLKQSYQVLKQYKAKYVQFRITGHNNVWILKPAGLSRGRGITCYNTLTQIQSHLKCKESQWIAQKYIENPLIIRKRKFDIRQWVLITDFNPLTIFIYDQCYIRFSALDYDSEQLSNKFIHLTNNSIGAYCKNFQKSHIKGNMFFQHELRQQIQKNEDSDIFEQKIKAQICEIIIKSMKCSLLDMENRKNSFQIFGYDFMIDDQFKVWLIQINSSPSMDYSTHVTSKLVKQMSEDLAKVVVDLAKEKEGGSVETGKFKQIYKGSEVNQKYGTAGLNLFVAGIGVGLRQIKRGTIKMQTFQIKN